jgi:hypothetical protein
MKQRRQRGDAVRFGNAFFGYAFLDFFVQQRFLFLRNPIGSCHSRASTSCAAIIGAVFSIGTDGRSLTSGLYWTTIPASTAATGSKVAQGRSNFRLSLSAMAA